MAPPRFACEAAVADLIGKVPVFRSVIAPLQQLIHLDPRERHALGKRRAPRTSRKGKKRDIERERRYLEKIERRERESLERRLRQQIEIAKHSKLDLTGAFQDAARRRKLAQSSSVQGGQVTESFNEAAAVLAQGKRAEDARKSSWKARGESKRKKRSRQRVSTRGYRYGASRSRSRSEGLTPHFVAAKTVPMTFEGAHASAVLGPHREHMRTGRLRLAPCVDRRRTCW